MGIFYAQLERFYSEGDQQQKRIIIGKSRKMWLHLNIIEANLTKDLEFFSKMDPYCRIALQSKEKSSLTWQKTRVHEDIGLKPVWNESFFI